MVLIQEKKNSVFMGIKNYKSAWKCHTGAGSMRKILRISDKLRLRQIFLALVFITLLSCFILQVRTNVGAFFAKRTIMSVSDEDMEHLEMPEIAFCPGFRPGSFDDHWVKNSRGSKLGYAINTLGQMTYFDYYGVDNTTESEIDFWWQSITYNLEDFVTGIIIGNEAFAESHTFRNMNEIELMPHELLNNDTLPVKIKQISSPYGRCFEVLSKLPFKSTEYITILFNLTEFAGKKVPVYIYEHGDIGLLGNYWVTQVYTLSMGAGETLDLPIVKEETSYLTNEKIPCAHSYEGISDEDEDEGHYHCILRWAQEKYRSMNCPKVCSLPQSYLYTSDMDPPIPPCLTSDEAHCVIRELNKIYSSQDRMRETGCNTACDRTSYRVTVRHEVSYWDGVSSGHSSVSVLTLFYPSSRVIKSVETRLLDNSAILSAIGGSLGLFLGFSFWECAKTSVQKLDGFIRDSASYPTTLSTSSSAATIAPSLGANNSSYKARISPPPPLRPVPPTKSQSTNLVINKKRTNRLIGVQTIGMDN